MPDMPALDVAIGLVFLYLVLALVCSTINETVSTASVCARGSSRQGFSIC